MYISEVAAWLRAEGGTNDATEISVPEEKFLLTGKNQDVKSQIYIFHSLL